MSKDNAVALANLAMIAIHTGHDEDAVRLFKSALGIRPDMVEAYIGIGLAYGRIDKFVEAVESFRQAVQLDQAIVRVWAKSSIPTPHKWLSFSPEYSHFTGEMAEFLHKTDEADALTRLAASHISHGLDEAAVTALEYCLQLIPDYEAAIILISIAYLLLDSKQVGAAAQSGSNSVLKKIAPRLASRLFRESV